MVTYKYNKPYYDIEFSELQNDDINVLSFEGEEKISDLFEYQIRIISKDPDLDSSKILNKNATFIFNRGDEDPIKIFGIISHFEQYGKTKEYVFYKVVLVPRLWRLNLTFRNEVYQKIKIEKLIESVLDAGGISKSDYKIDLKSSYPESEYIVQYRETNLNFLNRRLEHYGIYYYFDHKDEKDIVVFTDSNKNLPEIGLKEPIGFNWNKDPLGETESIFEINCQEKVVTGMVQLKDYNYLFPEKQLMAQSSINSNDPGLYYDFGDNFLNEKEAEALAKIRNQEILCQSKIFRGVSDCRLFRAGLRFKMDNHFRKDWNDEFILTRILYRGNQRGLFAFMPQQKDYSPTYECNFESIPFSIEFRSLRKTPIPKVSGIMSAKLESGSGDEYAFIDDHGRYKAKMLFDLSDKSNGEATLPIRLTQNYSGSGYGVHFPNHAGTELLWACVDGNPDRPIGLGTVPNPSTATPVTSSNKMQNVIRTASGNEFIMDDKSKESQIILNTTDANNMIFDDKDDKIQISTAAKHKVTMDDKNQNLTVKTKDGHLLILDDKNTKITVQSKNGHMICIDDGSGGENITLVDNSGENTFLIDISNSKLVIKTENGNIDMHAPNGKIDIQATEFNLETTGDTKLKAANISSEADVDYKLKASNITEEASIDFKMKGMNLEAKGDMNVKLEGGMNLEAKGGMTAKVEGGATADFKAGAKASLQAGIVMIN
jgi:type VI secretion system secreted protein VgrG